MTVSNSLSSVVYHVAELPAQRTDGRIIARQLMGQIAIRQRLHQIVAQALRCV